MPAGVRSVPGPGRVPGRIEAPVAGRSPGEIWHSGGGRLRHEAAHAVGGTGDPPAQADGHQLRNLRPVAVFSESDALPVHDLGRGPYFREFELTAGWVL